ncbi:MAG: phosphoethanolamine--lipid A transferase [Burkholderiales bacterium]|nr:phosphoethanolamine--lipid A transferase [Burkholderiales bacterium]
MLGRSFMADAGLTGNSLILLVAAFVGLFGNATFVANVLETYPPDGGNVWALLSLIIVFGGVTVFLLGALCFGRVTKPVLIIVLLLSSLAACFMDSYGVIISDDMLRNVAHTNTAEALELFNVKLLLYLAVLGILPALAVCRVPLRRQSWRGEVISRLKLLGATIVLVAGTVLLFGSFYASFFREHKELRQHANPAYYIYSTVKFAAERLRTVSNAPVTTVGADAVIPASDVSRELVIMVVGETARADRFSLNGYARETNPQLKQKNVVSFTNFRACGTSTAVSVPCMFLQGGDSKHSSAILTEENLLDVLQRSGVNVLWLDNNSDSKGVAARVEFRDFRSPKVNPVCDSECRDEGMLVGLQGYIDAHPEGDILIVLHQMGNHGPAYFRRYPPEFEKFRPVCKSSDLSKCSREEIGNAYDNAILYTDHFLAKAIALLEKNDSRFETALFYVSDHGESLGENGLYLHGLPKAVAPDTQLNVPAVMWFGANFHAVTPQRLQAKSAMRLTHNNVFHTILGFFEVESATYRPGMDILNEAKPREKP